MDTLNNALMFIKNCFNITINIKDFYNIFTMSPELSNFYMSFEIHDSRYCSAVKSNAAAFRHCVYSSVTTMCHYIQEHPELKNGFYGVCHAGVKEYVVPVYYGNTPVGAISAGLFRCARDRQISTFKRMNELYGLNSELLEVLYADTFTDEGCDIGLTGGLLKTCAVYLEKRIREEISEQALRTRIEAYHINKKVSGIAVNAAINYIRANIACKITLEDISEATFYSQSTISHCMKAQLGLTPIQYLNNVRINLAKKYLTDSHLKNSEIAAICGFGYSTYFSAVFRQITGKSPTQYRAENATMQITQ